MKIDRELKRSSAEMLILSLLEEETRHGYEILKLMEERSDGALKFHIGSVYPILFRLEQRGLIRGQWDSDGKKRRKRTYRITAAGQRFLDGERSVWRDIVTAIERVASIRHA